MLIPESITAMEKTTSAGHGEKELVGEEKRQDIIGEKKAGELEVEVEGERESKRISTSAPSQTDAVLAHHEPCVTTCGCGIVHPPRGCAIPCEEASDMADDQRSKGAIEPDEYPYKCTILSRLLCLHGLNPCLPPASLFNYRE
jgi:hypothetical protein